MKQLQARSKSPATTWRVANEASYSINQSVVTQQKDNTSMKLNHLFILIVIAGALLGFAMFLTANHAIDATPYIQQTAQVQAEWSGRLAIAQATSPFYTALQMFNGAATFGFVLLAVVALVGAVLWWKIDGSI